VKITTTVNTTIEGAVYGADVQGNTLAIIESPTSKFKDVTNTTGSFRIVTISAISNFDLLALPSEADTLPSAGKVDHDALQRREDELVRRLKEEEMNRGRGVTKEAQEVFDAMKRMYLLPLLSSLSNSASFASPT